MKKHKHDISKKYAEKCQQMKQRKHTSESKTIQAQKTYSAEKCT